MSEFSIAAIAGFIGGFAEFLPVSFTGHMLLLEDALDLQAELAAAIALFARLGAVCSVGFLYRDKYRTMISPKKLFCRPADFSVWHILTGLVPAAIVMLLVQASTKTRSVSYFTMILGLALGSVMMLLAEKLRRRSGTTPLEGMTIRQAFLVGLFHVFSLWPGFSQTASTISGGLFWGLDRRSAVDFSLMVALPLVAVEAGIELAKNWMYLGNAGVPTVLACFFSALAAAFLSVTLFRKFPNKFVWVSFAYYRLALAVFSYCYFFGH